MGTFNLPSVTPENKKDEKMEEKEKENTHTYLANSNRQHFYIK
jgi:hypothetical protein